MKNACTLYAFYGIDKWLVCCINSLFGGIKDGVTGKFFYYGETIFYSHLDLANGYKVDQNLKNKVSMSVDFFNSALLRRIMTFIE